MTLSPLYGPARPLIDKDYLRIGRELIQPFDPKNVQPASYDVTLGPKLLCPYEDSVDFNALGDAVRHPIRIDLRKDKPAGYMCEWTMEEEGYVLRPGVSLLAATQEMVTCPPDMLCSVDGKSTLGRCWIAIHATAGFIDPGFCGVVTLELTNHGPWNFVLYPGMKIGQLRFHWMAMQVARPYGSPGLGSHYQGAQSVAPASVEQESE